MWIPARFRQASEETTLAPANRSISIPEGRRTRLPGVLAITADDRLYYLLLSASIDLGWRIIWARTVGRAFELDCLQPMPIIICDERLPGFTSSETLPGIASFPGHPAVLLAASEVNEEIWERVLRCRGYDAVRRSAGSEEWKRELRFAWLSTGLLDPAPG